MASVRAVLSRFRHNATLSSPAAARATGAEVIAALAEQYMPDDEDEDGGRRLGRPDRGFGEEVAQPVVGPLLKAAPVLVELHHREKAPGLRRCPERRAATVSSFESYDRRSLAVLRLKMP